MLFLDVILPRPLNTAQETLNQENLGGGGGSPEDWCNFTSGLSTQKIFPENLNICFLYPLGVYTNKKIPKGDVVWGELTLVGGGGVSVGFRCAGSELPNCRDPLAP